MKVIIALLGAFAGAAVTALFLAQLAAAWYTGQAEFQSPDEFEETYSTVYLAAIAGGTLIGYLIGRFVGGCIEREGDRGA